MDDSHNPYRVEPPQQPAAYGPPAGQVHVEVVDEPGEPRKKRVFLPVVLFLLTCLSTFFAGGMDGIHSNPELETRDAQIQAFLKGGTLFSLPLMFILLCHEFGHYIQAVRYGVPASFPYFIPFPVSPLGTMGAVIAMRGQMGHRRALFDIGITGPLAGLAPAIICCIVGLKLSGPVPDIPRPGEFAVGSPLIFDFLIQHLVEPVPKGMVLQFHPMAFAGWVGLFITALNLFPIGQLDGGHILYALLRRRAYPVAMTVMYGAVLGMVLTRNFQYMIMLGLLALIGPQHPPTENDYMPLGVFRTVLGWLALAYVIIGFTPQPFGFTN